MAKVTIRDMPLKEAAKILAQSGITLDTHQLPDGTYRAYVRKDKIQSIYETIFNHGRHFDEHGDGQL